MMNSGALVPPGRRGDHVGVGRRERRGVFAKVEEVVGGADADDRFG
jgi:hypothetical protein